MGPTYQHEINNSLFISAIPKVLVVASREASANAMMLVHHTCDAIKPETVKLVFVHPETKIAQQEAQDFVMAIVEKAAVPEVVASLAAFVEVEMVSAVKLVDTVENILACVRVDNVKEDGDTQTVGCIDKFF